MKVTVRVSQEKMEATITPFSQNWKRPSKIRWKTSWRVSEWTQSLCEELNAKLEETKLVYKCP
jgi:hypothetical protein